MKKLAVLVLLACELLVGGCGSGTTSSVANANSVTSGLWGAMLTGGSAEASGAVLSFNIGFTVNGDGSLNVSQFSFNTIQTCFTAETESGTSSLTTTTGNEIEGTITFVITSTAPAGNTLTLMGNEVGSSITGSWTLAGGTGCTGGGSFTMTKSS